MLVTILIRPTTNQTLQKEQISYIQVGSARNAMLDTLTERRNRKQRQKKKQETIRYAKKKKIHQGTSPNSHPYQMNQTAPNRNENLVTNKRFTLLHCYSSFCFYGCYCHVITTLPSFNKEVEDEEETRSSPPKQIKKCFSTFTISLFTLTPSPFIIFFTFNLNLNLNLIV